LPLRKIAEKKWEHTLNPVIVKRQMGHINQGFDYAVSEGWALFNPGQGLLIPSSTATSRTVIRREFRPHELKKLLSSPLFNKCGGEGKEAKIGSMKIRNHKFWLPCVALYTGARLAELCQLETTNLRQEGDVWYLEITTIVDQDDVADKSLKTAGSTREVPVHQVLIDKGFIDYAQKGGTPYIFDTKFASPEMAAKDYSRWFGRYMSKIGLADATTTFHSTRHNFKTACRMANLQKEVHDFLTGHSPKDVGGKYGSQGRLMKYLKTEIDKVEYEGV
jgi:integrase